MRHRLALTAVLALTFLSFLFLPAYMVYLRHRLASALPSEWDKVTNNGAFTYVSPLVVTTRNHEEGVYAIKLRQIALHGLPYDPHTGDRTLKSWFFDSMMYLPLAPLLWPFHGDVQKAYILGHALFGMLWLLLFYRIFHWYTEDARCSLLAACAAFFFIDVWIWTFISILPKVLLPSHWDFGVLRHSVFLLIARLFGQIDWVRLPSPGMNFLWLAAALALCFSLALSKRRPLFSLAAGAAVGALGFSHFYEWASGVAGLLFFGLACAAARLPKEGLANLVWANAASISVSGVYYAIATSLTRDVMPDIISRMGMFGRVFYLKPLLFFALAALFWWRSRRSDGRRRWFWLLGASLESAAGVLYNLALLLGYDIQFGHFDGLAALCGILWAACWLLESGRLRECLRPHAYTLACLLLVWVYLREKGWAETHYKLFGTPRDVDAAAEWINKNTPRGSQLLMLSGALTEFLPLRLDDTRFAVSNGSPAYGSVVSSRDNMMGLARILKTVDADPALFLERRWGRIQERDDRKQHVSYYTRNLAWREVEDAAWAYFLLNVQGYRVEKEALGIESMMALYREARKIPPPFYFWVQKGDEEFLKTRPEKLGGALVYQNPSVRLYRFAEAGT